MRPIISMIAIVVLTMAGLPLSSQNIWVARCTNCPNNQIETDTEMELPSGATGFSYAVPSVFPNAQIAEDFGQRRNPSRCWHTGVDLNNNSSFANSDIGDAIYPLDSGEVMFIRGDSKYKVIGLMTHDSSYYGYGHIFYKGTPPAEGKRCGNFVLKKVFGTSNRYSIVYFNPEGHPVIAYSRVRGDTVNIKNGLGNDTTIYTTNVVNGRLPVAPLGISGTDAAHVHMYRFKSLPETIDEFGEYYTSNRKGFGYNQFSKTLNPATLITSTDLDYNIELSDTKGNIPETGSQRGSVVAKVTIPRSQWASNSQKRYPLLGTVDEVRFLIKKDHPDSSFSEIVGNQYYGHINLGGLDDFLRANPNVKSDAQSQRYPSTTNPISINDTLKDIAFPIRGMSEGSNSRTGIVTWQYNSASYSSDRAADYYYFSDFFHRITRGHDPHSQTASSPIPLARYPGEAQYPDGNYQLRAELETIHQELAASSPSDKTFHIDNFRPYITKVVVKQRWKGYLPFYTVDNVVYEGNWEWRETPSPGLYFKGNDLDPYGYFNPAQTSHPNTRGIYIEVHTSEPMQSLSISRCAPDPISSPFTANPSEIPASDFIQQYPLPGQVSSVGSDLFVFALDDNKLQEKHNGYHHFHFEGTDIHGNPLLGAERANNTFSFPNPITQIPVRASANAFSVNHAAAVDKVHGFAVFPYCGPKNGCLEAEISNPVSQTHFNLNQKITFNCSISGGKRPYNIRWDLGDGSSSTAMIPVHQYAQPGLYEVRAKVQDDDGLFRTTESIYVNIIDPSNPQPVARFEVSSKSINKGGELTFTDRSYGGQPPYSYSWGFSQATPSSESSQGPHKVIFNQIGKQACNLIVTDVAGNTSSHTIDIDVKPSTRDLALEVRTIPDLDEAVFKIMDKQTNAEAWLPGYMIDWDFGDGQKETGSFATSNRHSYTKGAHYTAKARIKHFFGKELILLKADVKLWPRPEPEIVVTSSIPMGPEEVVAGQPATYSADLSTAPVPPGYYFEYEWVFEQKGGTNRIIPYNKSNQHVQHTYQSVGQKNRIWLHVRARNANGTLISCGQVYGGTKCFFNTHTDVTVKACKQAYYLPYHTWQVDPGRFLVHGGTIKFRNAPAYQVAISPDFTKCRQKKKIVVPVGFFWEESVVDFFGYSSPYSQQRNDPFYNNRLAYDYDVRMVKLPYTGMSVSLGPTPILKPVQTQRHNFSADYLQVDWFEFDWDEFQKPGSGQFLYYAIINIKEKGCNESMTIVKQVCLSSLTEIAWSDVCEKASEITYAFGLDPQGNGSPVTRIPDTLDVTGYMLKQYTSSNIHQVMGKYLHSKGTVLIDSSDFHFKAQDEILFQDEFEVKPGNQFSAYIEDAGPVFHGCANYTGYVREGEAQASSPGQKQYLNLVPNPVRQGQDLRVQVFCMKEQSTTLSLFSLQGKRVAEYPLRISAGKNQYRIRIPGVAGGMYLARIRLGEEVFAQKVFINN